MKTVARPRTFDVVLSYLLGMLSNGKLKPGDRLPSEAAFSKQLSVSRPTLREVIKTLVEMGLVDVRHGTGTFVRSPTPESLTRRVTVFVDFGEVSVLELLEVWRLVELYTVEQAARLRTDEDLVILRELVAASETERLQPERYTDLEKEFHLAIARCAKAQFLGQVIKIIRERLRTELLGSVRSFKKRMEYSSHHRQLLEAIAKRQPTRAKHIMARHLRDLEVKFKEIASTQVKPRRGSGGRVMQRKDRE